MSLCKKVSNNKFFGCPARMDDGRHFTDYRPNCHVNNIIRNENQIMNSFDYRMYLTQNATQIMDMNRKAACDSNCSTNCMNPYNIGTMLPEKNITQCTTQGCVTKPNVFDGIGNGRNYSTSFNETYSNSCPGINNISDKSNCCAPANDLANYYPDSKIQGSQFGARLTSPSGGKMLGGGDPNYFQ